MRNRKARGTLGFVLVDLEPMLADRGLPRGELSGWAAEPKLDGWRVLVTVDPGLPGGVVVRTRRGHPITDRLSGIEALARLGRRVVLDGELVAGAGSASDFYGLVPRIARRRHDGPAGPVSIWAFDLLWLDDEPLLAAPYVERRARLEALGPVGAVRVLPRWPGDAAVDLLAACAEHDVEGIVLKRLRSIYRPGERTRHWRKVKTAEWSTVHRPRRGPEDHSPS
jgi:bifunctional non-homologous end joining protein LigD